MKFAILIPLLFTSFCPASTPQDGVQPVTENPPAQSDLSSVAFMQKLDAIEAKLDENLNVTKSVKQDTTMLTESQVKLLEALTGLKDSNKENADSIVSAIKSASSSKTVITESVARSSPVAKGTIVRSRYRSISSPRWNLNGSWSLVKSKPALVNHLATTHSYSRSWLDGLSINQLWAVHDDSHDGGLRDVQPVPITPAPIVQPPSNGCPNGVCPTYSRSRTFSRSVIFPNAWWNR